MQKPNVMRRSAFRLRAQGTFYVVKENPLPCESINFIIFLFILHRKYQNNPSEPKTS